MKIFNPLGGGEGGGKKKPFLKVAALVAIVTTAACSRPGASFSYKTSEKKSEMFISLSQTKYNITNWHTFFLWKVEAGPQRFL